MPRLANGDLAPKPRLLSLTSVMNESCTDNPAILFSDSVGVKFRPVPMLILSTDAGVSRLDSSYLVAVTIYMNDQKVCALNYKACILRKNGN